MNRIISTNGNEPVDQLSQYHEEIIDRLRQILSNLLADQPVMLAYLHGSVARKQTHGESDVDIALVLSKPLGRIEQLNLELDLNIQLEQAGVPHPDVRAINSVPIDAQEKIISYGVLLFTKHKDTQHLFEATVRQQASEGLSERNQTRQKFISKLKSELTARGLMHARH